MGSMDSEFEQNMKPSANAIKEVDETEDLQNFHNYDSLSFAVLATSNSINPLTNSWIRDGGLDIHISNDAKKWQFKIYRLANKGEIIQVENSNVPIEAYGKVRVSVDTPAGKKHITLVRIAFYIIYIYGDNLKLAFYDSGLIFWPSDYAPISCIM